MRTLIAILFAVGLAACESEPTAPPQPQGLPKAPQRLSDVPRNASSAPAEPAAPDPEKEKQLERERVCRETCQKIELCQVRFFENGDECLKACLESKPDDEAETARCLFDAKNCFRMWKCEQGEEPRAPAEARSPAEAFMDKLCPPAPGEPENLLEIKQNEKRRADCLEGKLKPLWQRAEKNSSKQARAEWKSLRDKFTRFAEIGCRLAEEVKWFDPETLRWSSGAELGLEYVGCRQTVFGYQAFLLDRMLAGDRKAFWDLSELRNLVGNGSQTFWTDVSLELGRAVEPPKPAADDAEQPDPGRTAKFKKLLAELPSLVADLGMQQCRLLPEPPGGCDHKLATWYYGTISPPGR
ncbi:MAG: hypothetical protein GYA21_17670 [Myxococcales bacterium]|nr:hypothetical protein [Myxococcales bacterium]